MIELKGIGRFYETGVVGVQALHGVNLTITQGEFVAIIGPSGSGKSTLMHLLGFLDRPNTGEYRFLGRNTSGLTDNELAIVRNQFIGFVFQQFHLLPRLDAVGNAMLPLVYAGKGRMRSQAEEKIAAVGLAARGYHNPNELSGGEQQRVAIARALVNDPVVIMADEPTGNLDSRSEEEIVNILKALHAQGKTIIMVTHEREIAANAGRIIQMRDGKIISDETTEKASLVKGAEMGGTGRIMDLKGKRSVGAGLMDHLRQASSAVFAHKVRSFLSMLGILIGVAAVIAMLAIGEGAKAALQKQLSSLGSNLIMVWPASRRVQGVALEMGFVNKFTVDEAKLIGELEHVRRISPTVRGRAQAVAGNRNWNTFVQGVGVDHAEMRSAVPAIGRFFTRDELENRARVAVVGATVVRELFGSEDPIGQTMKLDRVNFTIIGVLPAKGRSPMGDQDDTVLLPNLTAMYRLLGRTVYDSIDLELDDQRYVEAVTDAIKSTVAKKRRIPESKKDDTVEVRDMTEIKETLSKTSQTMQLLLGVIAGISLLVGGIGIMNIMIVAVRERTREIGLRKALGARGMDIMTQFLIESVMMTVTGGLIGVALGAGAALLITRIAEWPVVISPLYATLAVLFSGAIGIAFGLWPARMASKLDPIQALRYE